MSGSEEGTGRVPEDRFWSPQMSRKSKSACVRVCASVYVCTRNIYVCECVGLAVRKTVELCFSASSPCPTFTLGEFRASPVLSCSGV